MIVQLWRGVRCAWDMLIDYYFLLFLFWMQQPQPQPQQQQQQKQQQTISNYLRYGNHLI